MSFLCSPVHSVNVQIRVNFLTWTTKKGLARCQQIKCCSCEYFNEFYTSPQVESTKDIRCRGMKTMEVNVRAVYGFRSIGIGHALIKKLCGYLNMPPPMQKSAYDDISNRIKLASKEIAEKSMSDTADSLRQSKEENANESFNGTIWNRVPKSNHVGLNTLFLEFMILLAILTVEARLP